MVIEDNRTAPKKKVAEYTLSSSLEAPVKTSMFSYHIIILTTTS
jgi:hypothetical protein